MWYKEINNYSECNKKKKGGNNIKIEKETEVVIAMVSFFIRSRKTSSYGEGFTFNFFVVKV